MWNFLALLWERLTRELAASSPLDLLVKLLATIVLLALIYLAKDAITRIWARLKGAIPSWWECCGKLKRARDAVADEGRGLWLTIGHNPQPILDKIGDTKKLILTVANLKGGVGKTTLTANLAAFFANPFSDRTRPSRRVLVLDLDFQGSLSSMLFVGNAWRPNPNQLSCASEVICGAIHPGTQGQLGQPVVNVVGARGVSAFYDLARIENREMVRWLIGDEVQDIRYRLAHLLLSDAVLPHFDVILIDAPPRLTTASIQALCASTHVLIPTILDPLSADAVGYFGLQLGSHEKLWPHLKVMGIVGTMTKAPSIASEEPHLKDAGARLQASLDRSSSSLKYILTKGEKFELPYSHSVADSMPMARGAGNGIAYVSIGNTQQGRSVRDMIDRFGQEVIRRWQL